MNKNTLIIKLLSSMIICLFVLGSVFPVLGTTKSDQPYGFTNTGPHHYFTYQEMTDLLHNLSNDHSDIMSLTSIGKTYEGRDIWLVKLSDNVEEDEEEPGVLLMGAHHGNEKPSFEALIFFIQHMVENYCKENTDDDGDGILNEDPVDGVDNDGDGNVDEDPSEDRVRDVVDNTQIFLIPMVNPDGVEYGWRKNRAPNYGPFGIKDEITSYGVDLNRNYGYKWYLYYILPIQYNLAFTLFDESWNYRGEYPFSENETRAVRDFVIDHPNIEISLSYHSYSEVIMYPWTHTSLKTPDEDLFISIGENISKIDKYRLLINGWRNKSYIIPRFSGTLGTSENWLYGERGIISYTMELCKTRAPTDPNVVYDYCLKHVGVNLYVCERSWTVD